MNNSRSIEKYCLDSNDGYPRRGGMPSGLPVSLLNHLGEAHSDPRAMHDDSIGRDATDQEGDDG